MTNTIAHSARPRLRIGALLAVVALSVMVACDDADEGAATDITSADATTAADVTDTGSADTASVGDTSNSDTAPADVTADDSAADLEPDVNELDYSRVQLTDGGTYEVTIAWGGAPDAPFVAGSPTNVTLSAVDVATLMPVGVGFAATLTELASGDESQVSIMPGASNALIFNLVLEPAGDWQLDVPAGNEVATFYIEAVPP